MSKVGERARKKWSAIIDQQKKSGESVDKFCEINSINPNTFSFYKSRVNRKIEPKRSPEPKAFTKFEIEPTKPTKQPVDAKWLALFVSELFDR